MLPLPVETVLQGRYCLKQLLAEGGFARTYLAVDLGRFQERCAVKEFCPNQNSPKVLAKAQELFQREAQTLYHIKHPQVPQFRGLFTEAISAEERLFLVQDYVEGPTYRQLLEERRQQKSQFSESEVRQVLTQVLEVLAYIHGQGLIHRDISLENLIRRQSDQKPVLIDFGVVKTVMTQLQQTQAMPTGTVVGKFGYAPIEQLQSGRAYPSSDLYSLAVCCVVLLTGRDPAQLFDDTLAVWQWQGHATVSPGLATILERMLAYKPSDRYDSAAAVLADLQPVPKTALSPEQAAAQGTELDAPPPPAPDLSQMRTFAVGQPAAVQSHRPRPRPPVIPDGRSPQSSPHSIPHRPPVSQPARTKPRAQPRAIPSVGNATATRRSKPGLFFTLIVLSAIFSAGAGWLIMQWVLQMQQLNLPNPSRSVLTPPNSTPEPTTENPASISYSQLLQMEPGRAVDVQDSLSPGEQKTYRFEGVSGDRLAVNLSGDGAILSLLQGDFTPVIRGVTAWQGALDQTGTYYLRIDNPTSVPQSFRLNLALESSPAPEPSPVTALPEAVSPDPLPPVQPTITEQFLALTPENPVQQVSGQLSPGQVQRIAIPVAAGQAVTANVIGSSPVTLTVLDGATQPLGSAQKVLNWDALIETDQTLFVDITPINPGTPTDFTVRIGVRQP